MKEMPIENLEAWLSNKPYWEQYLWKTNLEKDTLSEEDIEKCYQYLSEHLQLIAPILTNKKEPISFKNVISVEAEVDSDSKKMKLLEIKDFQDVNAITSTCSIPFSPNLTLIYGSNGSGKSGIGRLLGNACFSRGDRKVLPDARKIYTATPLAKATFLMDDGNGHTTEIKYTLKQHHAALKCFSVFDSESVLIHLDQSNQIKFTPAQIKIFDKVAYTIQRLEAKLNGEKNVQRKNDPFSSMFLSGETSPTSIFCRAINGTTKKDDFIKHASFDDEVDGKKIQELEEQINEKRKLDIPRKKAQISADCQNLKAIKIVLQGVVNKVSDERSVEINELIKDILEKKEIVRAISFESFNNGTLSTIGSSEWRTLIAAAKILHERETSTNDSKEPSHCMLCQQELSEKERTLFKQYWLFLESKAESELSELIRKQASLIRDLNLIKATFPKFLVTDAGVKILSDHDSHYLGTVKAQFSVLECVLDDWVNKINKLQDVAQDHIPSVELNKIDELIAAREKEKSDLVDPVSEIEMLRRQVTTLKHRKEVASVKEEGLAYISYLNWSSKADVVNFSGIKMAATKKRTEAFSEIVANSYKGIFNQELARLGCEFNLVMNTSGEDGNTVKEYRLDFAREYNPSQILSEGEQNVCSLADFLTEIQLDKTNCGIIFDDPVTSLDHDRKEKIAQRLTLEANQRQVIIFTHDIAFMSQLAKHAGRKGVHVSAHWIKQVNGIPGYVEHNTGPKLTNIKSLKNDSQEAVENFSSLTKKEQEHALGIAFDYLRSACEALIEEMLFGGTIKRYEDHIRVQNLEEVIFDQTAALKIVDLHGRLSEMIPGHNRSDLYRQTQPTLSDLTNLRREFDDLEGELKKLRNAARTVREDRKDSKKVATAGW